jgi:diguanylate cyclase (GGDEF)-like protein
MNAIEGFSLDGSSTHPGHDAQARSPWWARLRGPRLSHSPSTSPQSSSMRTSPLSQTGALVTGLLVLDRHGHLIEPGVLRGEHWNDLFGAGTWPAALSETINHPSFFSDSAQSDRKSKASERRTNTESSSNSDLHTALVDREQWMDLAPEVRRCLRIRLFARGEHYVAWIDDVTERKQVERRLRYAAEHDALSGLLNQRGFHQRLQEKIAQADPRSIFLIYMDLDEFKQINDFFGHSAGDQLLRQIALRIRHHIRSDDVAARIGGDEFALLMTDRDAARVLSVVQRLSDALGERPYPWQGHLFSVGVSVGVIRLDRQISPADALAAADAACQLAKRAPVDSSVSLTDTRDLLAGHFREMAMAVRWRGQPFEQDLSCDMQAIVALDRGHEPIGFECLLRMHDQDGHRRLPDQFLPIARRHGLIARFDRWMLESTLVWLDKHLRNLSGFGFCSINLSGASLNDQHFMDRVCDLGEQYPDAVRRLCFEIGDAADSARRGLPRHFVEECKRQGIRIALDYYGAPRRALPNLLDLPVDFVKLSAHLTASAMTDSRKLRLLEALGRMADSLGIRCVACGIDDDRLPEQLAQIGIPYAQGFALALPRPRETLLQARPDALTAA